jgi:hypothetical protein
LFRNFIGRSHLHSLEEGEEGIRDDFRERKYKNLNYSELPWNIVRWHYLMVRAIKFLFCNWNGAST